MPSQRKRPTSAPRPGRMEQLARDRSQQFMKLQQEKSIREMEELRKFAFKVCISTWAFEFEQYWK